MLKIICLESWRHMYLRLFCKETKLLFSTATKLTLLVAFTGLKINLGLQLLVYLQFNYIFTEIRSSTYLSCARDVM